jgi:hypothetical protein
MIIKITLYEKRLINLLEIVLNFRASLIKRIILLLLINDGDLYDCLINDNQLF